MTKIDELAVALARRAMDSGGPETGTIEIAMANGLGTKERAFGVVLTVAEVRKPLVQLVKPVVQ